MVTLGGFFGIDTQATKTGAQLAQLTTSRGYRSQRVFPFRYTSDFTAVALTDAFVLQIEQQKYFAACQCLAGHGKGCQETLCCRSIRFTRFGGCFSPLAKPKERTHWAELQVSTNYVVGGRMIGAMSMATQRVSHCISACYHVGSHICNDKLLATTDVFKPLPPNIAMGSIYVLLGVSTSLPLFQVARLAFTRVGLVSPGGSPPRSPSDKSNTNTKPI